VFLTQSFFNERGWLCATSDVCEKMNRVGGGLYLMLRVMYFCSTTLNGGTVTESAVSSFLCATLLQQCSGAKLRQHNTFTPKINCQKKKKKKKLFCVPCCTLR
jgi:hypothetical protein